MKRNSLFLLKILLLGLIGTLISCVGPQQDKKPNIRKIYNKVASKHDADTIPVIVIPGVLGSNLKDSETGRSAWGVFFGDYLKPSSKEGINQLAVKPVKGKSLSSLETSLVPDGVLNRVKFKVFGLTVKAKAYANLMGTLGTGGFKDQDLSQANTLTYGDDHFTCYQFAYDWRYSNAYNAKKLDAFIKEKQKYLRKTIKEKYGVDRKDIKFNIVAHSMGGLMTRYYARYGTQDLPDEGLPKLTWSGAKNINKLILVSTPNSGSIFALQELKEGKRFAPKWITNLTGLTLDYYPPELLGTYPSIYELISRGRDNALVNEAGEQLDPLSYDLWKSQKWGLAGADVSLLRDIIGDNKGVPYSDEQLLSIADDHLRKCLKNARQFQRALDLPVSTKPEHMNISLYIGDAIETVKRVKLNSKTGKLDYLHYEAGDGTVIRSSVLADRNAGDEKDAPAHIESVIPYDSTKFIFAEHVKMTEDVSFVDNVLFELLREE